MTLIRGLTGAILLFLGREFGFLLSAAMAAFIGLRLTHLLPGTWPSWSWIAFIVILAVIASVLTLINERVGYFVCGFLAGGFLFSEFYAPSSNTIPLLPFFVGSVLGSVFIGLLTEWAMILVSCMIGIYFIHPILPFAEPSRTLASGGIFIVGALVQVVIFQMQKHSER